jgi:hypothetical protein
MEMKKIVYKDMSTKIVAAKDVRCYENDPEWLQTTVSGATAEVTCSDCDGVYLIDIVSEERTECPWCVAPAVRARAAQEAMTREARVGMILQHIYDSEIHLSIGWMWDGGIDYRIGADLSYIEKTPESADTDNIREAVERIADQVAKEYPDSKFTEWWGSL